ncbi:exonuclease [Colletotrichum sojae]|uniref:Exonuclease n=1 Tax=Colletotrichum sojae TaxID=2175907 RepID=A0A8H6MJF9_9PEZI|nr:exonuclease [Colletotrichum sojae]
MQPKKHSHPQAGGAVTKASEPSSAPATPFIHRGIAYSNLSAVEQDAVQGRLAGLCHSEQRLQKEGYNLPTSSEMPNKSTKTPRTDLPCPDTNPSALKRAAIVLDCEMAGTAEGQSELVQITMIDFLSGNVLLNCLVNPSRPIIDWREDITGINAASMQEAVARNEALHGWEGARAELWRFVDKETILIGQSVHNDLQVLRTSHARIIDSAVVTADAVLGKDSKKRKRWGLEALCHELLGIRIRKPSQTGNRGIHDALEDALATREVVLLCAREPDKLNHWACTARATLFKVGDSKRMRSRAGGSRPTRRIPRRNPVVGERWEDVVDWETWPKSPPDSD